MNISSLGLSILKMLVACLGLLWLSNTPLMAQNGKAVGLEIGFDFNFNGADAFMGGMAGVCIPNWNASARATFKGRLGSKRVLIESGTPDVLFQYRERRYLLGIEAEKRFLINEINGDTHFGAFVGALGGFDFANYRGSTAYSPSALAAAGMLGVYISDPSAVIARLGYTYFPVQTETVPNHRIYLSISVLIL